jgi:transposase
MQVVYERCCGLDVHQKTVVACRLLSQPGGTVEKSIRTFATTTNGLRELDHWLAEEQVEQVALAHHGHLLASRFQSAGRPL